MSISRRQFLQFAASSAALAAIRPSGLWAASAAAQEEDFAIRGLEFAGSSFWQWSTIDRALDLMQRLNLNALILGQDDLPNSIVWPKAYFSEDYMFARDPTHMTVSHSGADYLRQVSRRAAQRNIQVYLEAKEISYPYLIVELHPEVMEIKGVVCPTHPFWWEFERARYQEIVETLPDIAGVVISAGSSESKVSFATRTCTCERCRDYAAATWHENLVRSIYEPLHARGKRVVVRDYSASPAAQAAILEGCARIGANVAVSLKSTPQEFSPLFPDNPRLGRTTPNPNWVEIDAMGQYAGLGVFPVGLADDLRSRVRKAKQSGATGIWIRADLEAISDDDLFNSLNLANLKGVQPLVAVEGLPNPLGTASEQTGLCALKPDEQARFSRFLQASWQVMAKTVYVRGLIFADGIGALPDSLEAAFDHLLVLHARDRWEPGVAKRIEPTAENIAAIVAEKDQAQREAAALPAILNLRESPFPPPLQAPLEELLKRYQQYVRSFREATVACFAVKRAQTTRAGREAAAAKQAVAALSRYADEVAQPAGPGELPHFMLRLLDRAPAQRLAADLAEKIAELEWMNQQQGKA